MRRLLVLTYGVLSYIIGLVGLLWFIVFIGPWDIIPTHIDSGGSQSLGLAILINIALVTLFGLQHSVMARQSFKTKLLKIMPEAMERSTYVLFSGVVMALICLYWQPIEGYLWRVDDTIGRGLLIAGFIFGWVFSTLATFLINHFELFGLQQVYFHLRDRSELSPSFEERYFYKRVRHPIQLGVLIGLWSSPDMSMTHLMLSITFTIYIFIGLYYEEKDLVSSLGEEYEGYQQRVRMMLPFLK